MEKYIITFEDGEHYIASQVTESDRKAVSEGLLSVIRTSDCKLLNPDGSWEELDQWGS